MSAEAKNGYFQELTLNLQHEGFVVKPETEEGLLPVELDGQRLCLALETAPQLTASGLTGDYKLLADFNDVVLAGHPTKYGVQFITWEWVRERTGLYQGDYYGPGVGTDSYTAAKRDFATRSGLIPRSAFFDQKQMIEIYHCCVEVQAGLYSITDEQGKCLQSIIDQIERSIPNLGELLDQEQKIDIPEASENGRMQFS